MRIAGQAIEGMLDGLHSVNNETMQVIMEHCGDACAKNPIYGNAYEKAKKIANEETDEARIIERLNEEILWCGRWKKVDDTYQSTCLECGCPLLKNEIVKESEYFCYCSRRWVKTIFSTLLGRTVDVELRKAIGFGDSICHYVVKPFP